ncbi:MAG: tannase/feruloyl esterase family alpha/beta hydrolase [Desulfosarcinaceae bacterium]|nr:tannase/feruloyl esterase family alpha/beta hydrolase [Desulfosarcinaceae bacterium]
MKKNCVTIAVFWLAFLITLTAFSATLFAHGKRDRDRGRGLNLEEIYMHTYEGGEDGGLAHVTYWGLPAADSEYYDSLPPEEQAKAGKINVNVIHAAAFQPTNADIAGMEVTGLLKKGKRQQRITFRLPRSWNGKLVVAGTPGLRNEYANEAVLVPWLLEAGYAYIAGDKGIPGGAGDMISGKHPTQHWGMLMIDLAMCARRLLTAYADEPPTHTYVMGLSNGGYQTRRALEIDHKRVRQGKPRLFDGGVDWSGAYWPDRRILDADGNGKVSVAEYAAADSLVGSIDKGTLAMGWYYAPETLTTPTAYAQRPRFSSAYLPMVNAGFSPESALFWGYYNTTFDGFQYVPGFEAFRGVGYYNLVSYVYRADLRGDDAATSQAYSCYADPNNPNTPPPLYEWLRNAPNGGWNQESVRYALKNANSGEFSAPLLSLHGQHDGLVALNAQSLDYADAVARFGNPDLHRLYIIANAGHVDKHADGGWGYSSAEADPDIPDLLTPMQAYAQRAFLYLEKWVEEGVVAPASRLVETDPTIDVTDPSLLDW